MFRSMKALAADQSGVTAIEYALIASLIAVFIITAVQTVGTRVSTVFNEIGTTLKEEALASGIPSRRRRP